MNHHTGIDFAVIAHALCCERADLDDLAELTVERYYELFTEHDQFFQQRLLEIVQAGVADGTFREVDPKQVVLFVYTTIGGIRTLRATSRVHDVESIRAALNMYLDAVLYPRK